VIDFIFYSLTKGCLCDPTRSKSIGVFVWGLPRSRATRSKEAWQAAGCQHCKRKISQE